MLVQLAAGCRCVVAVIVVMAVVVSTEAAVAALCTGVADTGICGSRARLRCCA